MQSRKLALIAPPATGNTWREALAAECLVRKLIESGELPSFIQVEVEPAAYRRWALTELYALIARGWNPEEWTSNPNSSMAALARLRELVEVGKARADGGAG